jgi:hypothetical protein
VLGLLLGRRGETQEQGLFVGIGLGASDLAVQPRRLFLMKPAVKIGAQDELSASLGRRCRASVPAVFVFFLVVPVIIIVVVLIPVVIVVVLFFFLFLLVLIFSGMLARPGPALRLLGRLEVHLVPRLEVYLLHVPIEVLDLDELGILIDREHPERLLLLHILIPPARDRLVISAHRSLPRGLSPPLARV